MVGVTLAVLTLVVACASVVVIGSKIDQIFDSAPSQVSVDCSFVKAESFIYCENKVKHTAVDCNVESKLNVLGEYWKKYDLLGISRIVPTTSDVNAQFDLFPKSNHTWFNNTISSHVHLALTHRPSTSFIGLRVVDAKCWSRMLNFFKPVDTIESVHINSELIEIIGHIHFVTEADLVD